MVALTFTVIQHKTEMVAQTVMLMDGRTQTQILFGQIHLGMFLMVQMHFSKIIHNGMIPILTNSAIIGQILVGLHSETAQRLESLLKMQLAQTFAQLNGAIQPKIGLVVWILMAMAGLIQT
jgi:hypothetical protein